MLTVANPDAIKAANTVAAAINNHAQEVRALNVTLSMLVANFSSDEDRAAIVQATEDLRNGRLPLQEKVS